MKKKLKKVILYIPATLLLIISVYPMLWTLCGSINTESQLGRLSLIPEEITLRNFTTIFTEYEFTTYIANTVFYSIIVMICSLVVNSMAAYALARLKFRGKKIVFVLVISTMMIPFSVTMIPLFVIIRGMGLTDSLWALILPSLAGGFGIFLLRQFYLSIPVELEDAAKIDGLSYFGIYRKIIIPLSKPIMLSLGLFAFLSCWNSYLWPLIVNTDEEYWVISTGIASFSSARNTDWNMILAGAVISMAPTAILFAFFQRYFVEGIKVSGIKG